MEIMLVLAKLGVFVAAICALTAWIVAHATDKSTREGLDDATRATWIATAFVCVAIGLCAFILFFE